MEQHPILSMEYSSKAVKPERQLWAAVILTALEEYESWCRSSEKHWREWNQPAPRSYWMEILDIRRHCTHRWFGVVCALADIEHEWIIDRLQEIDREYCINSIPFDQGGEILSIWQKRALNKKQLKVIN
jgi:hypothetical protein